MREMDLLPESIQEIMGVIGYEDTLKLVSAIGGVRFKFGKGMRDTVRLRILCDLIGDKQTQKLLRVFGGDSLYIPRCVSLLQAHRNRQFCEEFHSLQEKSGQSKAMVLLQLCPKYGISNRTADVILKKNEQQKPNQFHLF